ncbi:Acetyltransferase (GNAT) domain-containing protein [Chitinophaga jiangningensis]|uniref:Acetyltransferase (GNAT) domain-containing protein n=1 Tax=Chitinophaga jiangningensis TaxID=1419482 RepID=A0A1M7CP50_9BACT|nr:GNAT family N-acetyltransferase [Chitinophaga jiangningensis]SHL68940.1 Acetyltransferase (GNAT) domain-containing protein [Chitinophaga jiangningensis]
MESSQLSLVKLVDKTQLKPFDCGDETLNTFLTDKALAYHESHLATTYILQQGQQLIAYFSIFCDCLRLQPEDFPTRSAYKKFLSEVLVYPKRHLKELPAIKIGRLAVSKDLQAAGMGRRIIEYVMAMAMEQNTICACKLVTVDAYRESIPFYERLGFNFASQTDTNSRTRIMFFDLAPDQ